MKLLDVFFRDVVRRPGDNTPASHYKAADYELTFEGGLVTIKSAKGTRIVPASNVLDMTPLPEAKK